MSPFPEEEPVTLRDIAAFYKVRPETIRTAAKAGEIPGFQIGGKLWRFYPSQVEAVLNPAKADTWAKPTRKRVAR